jgi:hypothetical protein
MVGEADCGSDRAGRGDPHVEALLSKEIPILHSLARPVIPAKSLYTANMSSGVSVDEFQALEQKVLRAVEIVKREREARAAADTEIATLREQLAAQAKASQSQLEATLREKAAAESQVATLNQDREAVRLRVEKMLQQMDELV